MGKVKGDYHHPRSRKADQLLKKSSRTERLDKQKAKTQKTQSQKAKICKWVKLNLEVGKSQYTTDEIHALINKFLDEKDAEYEAEKAKKGNKISTQMELQHYALRQAYNESNFEMPDLTKTKVVNALHLWDGDIKFLQNFQMIALQNPNQAKAAWDKVNADKKKEEAKEKKQQKKQQEMQE